MNNMKKISTLFFLFTIWFNLSGQISIDSTFGIEGKVRFNFQEIKSILPLEDGKILMSSEDNIVTRLTKNGQIDETFGKNGTLDIQQDGTPLVIKGLLQQGPYLLILSENNNNYVLVTAPLNGEQIEQIINLSFDFTNFHVTNFELHNDKLLVVGGIETVENSGFEYAILRFLQSGERDSSFGENGLVLLENQGGLFYRCVDNGNKIILLGLGVTDIIAQFNEEGVLDSTFGKEGIVHFKNSWPFGNLTQLHLIENDKILLTGTTGGHEEALFVRSQVLYRLNSDGSFDETFGDKGKVSEGFSVNANEYDLDLPRTHSSNSFLQENGKIILVGRDRGSINNPNEDISYVLAVRYFPNGEIDNAFGINGKLIIPNFIESNSHFAYQHEDYFIFTVSSWRAANEHYIMKLKENEISTSSLFIRTNSFFNAKLSPNLTRDYSKLEYGLNDAQDIEIEVINFQGQVVETFNKARQSAGGHEFSFSTTHLPKGFYIVRLKGNNQELSLPLIKL